MEMNEKGYIYATLKSNSKKNIPTIGFISHYDTSPDCSGKNVNPRIIRNYDGGDIVLSEGIIPHRRNSRNCFSIRARTSS